MTRKKRISIYLGELRRDTPIGFSPNRPLVYYTQSSSSLHWEADAGLAVLDRAFLTLAGI